MATVETLKRPKISQASLKHYSTAEVREEEQVLSPLSSLFKVHVLYYRSMQQSDQGAW